MKLYLAGPMRGYPLYNFPAFDRTARLLREASHHVISPAELDRDIGFDETSTDPLPDGFVEDALRRDVAALLEVDAIALMDGWRASSGARFELDVARKIGLEVYEVRVVDGHPSKWCYLEELDEDPELTRLLAEEAEIARRIARDGQAGEVRVTSETGGQKGSKPARFDMIPPDVLWELAEHYGRGEAKYPSDPDTGEANWQKGYRWSLSAAALQRHLFAWLNGEDVDPETGSSHLVPVMWHAAALRWFQLHGRGTDDLQGRREVAA